MAMKAAVRQNRFVFFYDAIKSSISALDDFIIIWIIKLCFYEAEALISPRTSITFTEDRLKLCCLEWNES